MTEEENFQILNKQLPSKPSFEQDNHQHSAYLIEQPNGTQDKEDSKKIKGNTETTLWSMNFYGSCSKTNSGSGIWLYNTKKNYSKAY